MDDPTIRDFISSIPNTFSDTFKAFSSSQNIAPNESVLKNRNLLQRSINKFHSDADTVSGSILDSISILKDPSAQIVFSVHQPNLFPYGGVLKKVVLLQKLKEKYEEQKRNKKIVNLFVVVDHDFMDETWIHRAQLPSIRSTSGALEIRFPIQGAISRKMICNTAPPSRGVLESWKGQIYRWIKNTSQDYKEGAIENFRELWYEVEKAHADAHSYADFNSFFVSRLVNRVWGYDCLFVRLTDLSLVFEDGFKYLIQNNKAYSKSLLDTSKLLASCGVRTNVSPTAYLKAPLWVHCKCGSKASVKLDSEHDRLALVGNCQSCNSLLSVSLGTKSRMLISRNDISLLSPKAIPIILLFSRDLGASCYVSGTGGIDYMVYACKILKSLSVSLPMILFWPSRDIYHGIGQSEALRTIRAVNEYQVQEYLTTLEYDDAACAKKIRPLLEERERLVKRGQPIDILLEDIFGFKEKQRNIRKLIKLAKKTEIAVRMSPCFIDYAVNFGMKNIAAVWSQNLVKNDRYIKPLLLDQRIENRAIIS